MLRHCHALRPKVEHQALDPSSCDQAAFDSCGITDPRSFEETGHSIIRSIGAIMSSRVKVVIDATCRFEAWASISIIITIHILPCRLSRTAWV